MEVGNSDDLNQKLIDENEKDNLEISNSSNISKISNYELLKTCLNLGVTTFGGPIVHIGMFNKVFVQEKKIINDSKFTELFAISNVIPGPTSTQLLTAITIYKTRSVLLGLASFCCFNLPSLILMITIAHFIKSNNSDNYLNYVQPWIGLIKVGVWQAAVALVLQAAIMLSKKVSGSFVHKGIIFISCLTYLFFNSYIVMLSLMFIAGLISLYFEYEDSKVKVINTSTDNVNKDQPNIKISTDDKQNFEISQKNNFSLLGFNSLYLLVIIYIIILLAYFFLGEGSLNLYLMKSFYEIGASVIGGGHVVIPLIFSHFNQLISQQDILNCFSIISVLPGPLFNISGYIGTFINGISGGLLSALCIYLPGLLFLFFALGMMEYIKSSKNLQTFLKGVSDAAIGFIFSSVVFLWIESCYKFNVVVGTLNVLISFFFLMKTEVNVIFVIVICSLFYAVVNYLLLPRYILESIYN